MASAARRVWQESRAKNGALLVLMAIAFECDKGSEVEMSVTELARKARLSERAARNGVRELEDLKEIFVTPSKGARSRYAMTATPAESAALPRQNLPPGKICTPADIAGVETDTSQVSTATPADIAGVEISDNVVSTTGRSLVAVKDVPAKPPRADERPDVDRLCEHLADRIAADGSKRPAITKKWRDAARLLIDKDGRTEEQVRAAIDWSQDSEFWRANILSMPKLREKYTTLQKQAMRGTAPKPNANENLGYIADYMKRNGVDI